ncbi:MAG: DUF4159 domain-containing protein [Phycisphaerae bacterium]
MRLYRYGTMILAAVGLLWSGTTAVADSPDPERIAEAVAAGRKHLIGNLTARGPIAGEFPADNIRYSGRTALALYAAVSAGADVNAPTLRKSYEWLVDQPRKSIYAVSMRACALAALGRHIKTRKLEDVLSKDVKWLIAAARPDGSYTYTPSDGSTDRYDNSNSQMAAFGVWTGARALGMDVSGKYWEKVERHWISQQQPDGGWGYLIPPGRFKTRSYGSMTAAGLATLHLCFNSLHNEEFIKARPPRQSKSMQKALAWLGKNFDARNNPGKNVQWYYYWLFSAGRVGLVSGRKYIGKHDWYPKCAKQLLKMQNRDGSWGYDGEVDATGFALLFLARGGGPVLLNKLEYTGKWNPRPRDAANYARWITWNYEKPVSWQVVDTDSSLDDLNDAPILYISGAGPAQFRDSDLQKLRTFILQGGLILSEAAGSNADFTMDMQRFYRRMFPEHKMQRVPADDEVYTVQSRITDRKLLAIGNGIRHFAIHAPRELSLALHLNERDRKEDTFKLLSNIYLMATGKGRLRPRAGQWWPPSAKTKPTRTIRVARIRHEANWNPEPLAYQRLAADMLNRHKVRLDFSKPMSIDRLKTAEYPVAMMTGTGKLSLSDGQKHTLRKYFADGGTLIADAAGGDEAFGESLQKELAKVLPRARLDLLDLDHPVYVKGPKKITKVGYRKMSVTLPGRKSTSPMLEGLLVMQRPMVILSKDDLTCGLVGYQSTQVSGYRPQSAMDLMINILHYADSVTGKPLPRKIEVETQPSGS